MKKNKNLFILGAIVLAVLLLIFLVSKTEPEQSDESAGKKINALMMLIEFEKIDGVLQWEKELDQRSLSALLSVQINVVEANAEYFKSLADKGYEIAGGCDEEPFWDVSYEEQYACMKETKEKIESITGREMQVFNSKYFAYDENTLKAAEELGVKYVLGRGVNDIEAVVYKPAEYDVQIISVSNVDVGEPMGRGSLCDYSLWARGAEPADFGTIVEENLDKNPDNMILVSHAYLGGTRLAWWQEYEKVLASDKITWATFSDWLDNQEVVTLANEDIPVNYEVKYNTPSPAKEIHEYEAIAGLENCETNMENNELMCF